MQFLKLNLIKSVAWLQKKYTKIIFIEFTYRAVKRILKIDLGLFPENNLRYLVKFFLGGSVRLTYFHESFKNGATIPVEIININMYVEKQRNKIYLIHT